jgi:hypothetical protein
MQTNGTTDDAETNMNVKEGDAEEVNSSEKVSVADPQKSLIEDDEKVIKEEETVKQEAEVTNDQNEEIEEVEVEEFFVKYKNL